MGLTTLPTKSDASLGRVKADRPQAFPRTTDLRYEVPATELEAIKTALVDVCDEAGVHTGAAGSLNARVAALETVQRSTSQTTDATPGVKVASFTLDDNTVYALRITVLARDLAGTHRARYYLHWFGYRQGGGAATAVTSGDILAPSESDPSLAIALSVSGNNVEVLATGLAGTQIQWGTTFAIEQVT